MIGIVYKATDRKSSCVVKVGSTTKSLASRARDKSYKDCVLTPIRTDEYEDTTFGVLHLRVRETFEISKLKTWMSDGLGGRNILNPTRVWVCHLDDAEMRSYAGTIGGTKTFQLYGNPSTPEGAIKGGSVAGRKNVESGWAKELGNTYGATRGQKEVQNGHLASFRTKEHQISAGKKGGQKVAESGLLARALHIRWHVNRNISKHDCFNCTQRAA